MIGILEKYKYQGSFFFKIGEQLKDKCNAPTDKSGVYLIYKIIDSREILLYIGSSGQKKNGILKTRKSGLGGIKDRIVNGYHPKFERVARRKSFPVHMKIESIPKIRIYWWVTYDDENKDFPTDVETAIRVRYLQKHGTMPEWH